MFTRVCLTLALLSAVPGWSQATKNVTEGNTDAAHEPSADELPVVGQTALGEKDRDALRNSDAATGAIDLHTVSSYDPLGVKVRLSKELRPRE